MANENLNGERATPAPPSPPKGCFVHLDQFVAGCMACKGTAAPTPAPPPSPETPCSVCGGTGEITRDISPSEDFRVDASSGCGACRGRGTVSLPHPNCIYPECGRSCTAQCAATVTPPSFVYSAGVEGTTAASPSTPNRDAMHRAFLDWKKGRDPQSWTIQPEYVSAMFDAILKASGLLPSDHSNSGTPSGLDKVLAAIDEGWVINHRFAEVLATAYRASRAELIAAQERLEAAERERKQLIIERDKAEAVLELANINTRSAVEQRDVAQERAERLEAEKGR